MTRRRGLNRDPRNSAGAQRAMSMARNASIGSQVGSSLGGHLSSIGKTGTTKGLSISGVLNSIQSGWNSFTNNPANALGDVTGKISQLGEPSDFKVQAGLRNNLDYTDMNPSFRIGINVKNVIDSIPDAGVRGWFNQHTPDETKAVKINHQMYSPTKLMPGDDGWTPTGTGSAKIDSDSLEFLKWAAKNNPTGRTVAEAEKQYERQLNEGMDLYTAMRFNPAETGSIYSLLANPESTPEPTPEPEPKPTMDLNKIYNELLGRDVGQEGRDYWGKEFDSGKMSIQNIRDSIKQSPEYKGRQSSTIQLVGPSYMPSPTTPPAPSRSITNPYATDPNYTTTAPTDGDPYNPIKAGGNTTYTQTWNKDDNKWDITSDKSPGQTYYKTGGNQTIKADLDPVYSGYQGAAETGYTRTVPSYTGTYDKDSKHGRAFENVYHQNILDELTRYAQQSGIGNFAVSDGSTPQWMPVAGDDYKTKQSEHYRNQASRATEDLWQQGQISDLEKWAQSVVDTGTYAGLGFTPSEVYHGYGKDGVTYSEHTNEGVRRNLSQSKGIESLIDFISKLDTARGPEIAAEKDRLSGIYGAEIDRTYNELFETDTGIDAAGKEYWTKDLIENRPNLAKGQDWQDWLVRAFKETPSYMMHEASRPPDINPYINQPDINPYINYSGGGSASSAPDYATLLSDAKKEWDLGWEDQIKTISDNYTSQLNDIKSMFEMSQKSNADLLKGYRDQVASYQKAQEAQAAYGERPMNQSVKGVKTRNELPGYKPKTGGSTGHFNRTGSRLSTQSLNVA